MLVVEDDADLRAMIAESLERDGFAVACSETAADADDRLKAFAYDALVVANVEGDFFSRAQLKTAADFVAERGGGLLILGGRSFAQRGLSGTPLEEVLPVELNDRRGGGLMRTSLNVEDMPPHNHVVLTAEGETHPIMRTLYDVKEVPQVCAIQLWNPRFPNRTSERGTDSTEVHFRGIQDARGRLMVIMSHNTDIADTWEREGESQEYFDLFSPRGYAIGVNVVLYAMTH